MTGAFILSSQTREGPLLPCDFTKRLILVGRTPWSARVPLDPFFSQLKGPVPCGPTEAGRGARPRGHPGRGRPPHHLSHRSHNPAPPVARLTPDFHLPKEDRGAASL